MRGKERGTGCTLRSVGGSGFVQQVSAGTRAREVGKEILLLTSGAQGPVFAPAKPAFPPSMAVAEPRIRPPTAAGPAAASRISCHAVAAKPARQGWHPLLNKDLYQHP